MAGSWSPPQRSTRSATHQTPSVAFLAEQPVGVLSEDPDIGDEAIAGAAGRVRASEFGEPSGTLKSLLEEGIDQQKSEQGRRQADAAHVLCDFSMNGARERVRRAPGAEERFEMLEALGVTRAARSGGAPVRDEIQQVRQGRPAPRRLPVDDGYMAAIEIHIRRAEIAVLPHDWQQARPRHVEGLPHCR